MSLEFSIRDVGRLGFSSHSVRALDSTTMDSEDRTNAMTNNVYGINHRQTPLAVPINKDHYGLTFFTRPQLNFQSPNLRRLRIMHPLLTQQSLSYGRFIRCTLDPRLQRGLSNGDKNSDDIVNAIECPLVDDRMAFIPVLTNSLTNISGWPDIKVPTFTSREGPYKEAFSMVDGITVDYSSYTLTANFRNSRGDPITSMFYYWAHYMANVFEGTLVPYADMIVERELDYCTRIYRLVLDPTKRKVQRIAACGAAFPVGVPTGSIFDFAADKPYNDANSTITIPFQAMGFICQDDILIRTFNETQAIFNESMEPGKRSSQMQAVPIEYLKYFNNRGYPYIDPNTRELIWYVDKAYYNAKLEALKKFDSLLDYALGFAIDNSNTEPPPPTDYLI